MPTAPRKPVTAITLGDPAGIGPEIVLETILDGDLHDVCAPFVVGNRTALERAAVIQGRPAPRIHPIDGPEQAEFRPGTIDLLDTGVDPEAEIDFGRIQVTAARQAYSYIERSIDLGLAGRIDAVSTSPINKAALAAAGIEHIGHTEIYQHLTGAPYALTMFNVHKLRVFFATRHVALREACDLITRDRIRAHLVDIDYELRRLGIPSPRIAVAALNPHVGENGMFGTEEIEHLAPAVADAQDWGIDAVGPLSADAIFAFALDGRYDAILSLYHDQGHIACKTHDFHKAVTITHGLPFMRSSVDHGTAFDIAGTGVATGESMIEATRVCARYATMAMRARAEREADGLEVRRRGIGAQPTCTSTTSAR